MTALDPETLTLAARWIRDSDALLITAGAGMGVDSGLPDFRGTDGFWKAYPPFKEAGLEFHHLANISLFRSDPALAWGFYGHRLQLYRETAPHDGFQILRKWAEQCSAGYFVFTSNVDGQFARAGFAESRIAECHGSIHFLQDIDDASSAISPADHVSLRVDPATFRASAPLPERNGLLQRPSILMFNDVDWNPRRYLEQQHRLYAWLKQIRGRRLTIIELGAGCAIPTVRVFSETMALQNSAHLIRINPRDHDVPAPHTSLRAGAKETLQQLDLALRAC